MLVVLSGPSGVSKSYLCWEVVADFSKYYIPRKHTTRERRPGEDDREYFFVDEEEFKRRLDAGEFETHTRIYDNWYGLSFDEIASALAGQRSAIFILDVFIAQEFKRRHPDCVLVYVMPPDLGRLDTYLRARSEAYGEDAMKRLALVNEELMQWSAFDYVLPYVNSEIAYQLLRNVLIAEGCRPTHYSPEINPDRSFQFRSLPRLAVDLVVVSPEGGAVMLIERWKEPLGWALPGGFVQYGESVENAVRRECQEETGLEPNEVSFLGVFSAPNRDPRMHVVTLAFLAKIPGTGRPGGDARNVRWYGLENLPDQLAFDHESILALARQRLAGSTDVSVT